MVNRKAISIVVKSVHAINHHETLLRLLQLLDLTLTWLKAINMAADDVKPLMTGNEMNCTIKPKKQREDSIG